MMEQETDVPVAERLDRLDRMVRPADIGQAIAAIIAITRREWMSQGDASPAPDATAVIAPDSRTRYSDMPWM